MRFVTDLLGEPPSKDTARKPEQLSFVDAMRDFFSPPPEPQPVYAVDARAALRRRTNNYVDTSRQLRLPFDYAALSTSDGPPSLSVSEHKERLTDSFDQWRTKLNLFASQDIQVTRNELILFVQFITKTLLQMRGLAESDKSTGTKYLPDDYMNQIFQPIMTASLVLMSSSGVIPVLDETKVLPTELDKLAKALIALGEKIKQDPFDAWVSRYNKILMEYATEKKPKKLFIAP